MVEAGIHEVVPPATVEQLQSHVECWSDPSGPVKARINQEATPMARLEALAC